MVKVAKIATQQLTSAATNYTAFVGKTRAEALFLDMLEKAEAGDTDAIKIIADRIFPKAKAGNFFKFKFSKDLSIEEQMAQILSAVAKGQIDVDSACSLINAYSKFLETKKNEYNHTRKIASDKAEKEDWLRKLEKHNGDAFAASMDFS